ncbi:MAG: hypothetical protein ACR2K1_10425 [Saprospiraceae bacterium]
MLDWQELDIFAIDFFPNLIFADMKKYVQTCFKTVLTAFLTLSLAAGAFAQGDPGTDDDGFFVVI